MAQYNQREQDRLRNTASGPAVAVVNADGSAAGNATVTLGPGLVTITMGTALSSAIDSISAVPTGNITLNPSNVFIGLVTAVQGGKLLVSSATAGSISVSTTPTLILASDVNTFTTFVQNISNTTVFISSATGTCNASLAVQLTQNSNLKRDNFTGPWFASVATGGGEVRFLRDLL